MNTGELPTWITIYKLRISLGKQARLERLTYCLGASQPALTFKQTTQVGHLAGMLEAIAHDTDQAHPYCRQRLVPGFIQLRMLRAKQNIFSRLDDIMKVVKPLSGKAGRCRY